LLKFIYGLKQSSRQSFFKLSYALVSKGYTQSSYNHSLLIKARNVNYLITKIELLYEIRTNLLGNHGTYLETMVSGFAEIGDKSLPLPFTCPELRVFNGANH